MIFEVNKIIWLRFRCGKVCRNLSQRESEKTSTFSACVTYCFEWLNYRKAINQLFFISRLSTRRTIGCWLFADNGKKKGNLLENNFPFSFFHSRVSHNHEQSPFDSEILKFILDDGKMNENIREKLCKSLRSSLFYSV